MKDEKLKPAISGVRECFESDNVIITKIIQGHAYVRIDAKTRNHVADSDNFFSKWVSEAYAERLARENYGKSLSEFRTYQY